jgi:hypothetical protein
MCRLSRFGDDCDENLLWGMAFTLAWVLARCHTDRASVVDESLGGGVIDSIRAYLD